MGADHLGDFLHRLDLGAHHAIAPGHQHGSNHVDLFALQYRAQLFLVGPRPGRSLGSQLGNQGIQIGRSFGLEPGGVFEQGPAHAFERFVRFLLNAAHVVHRGAGVSNDVKLVECDPGVRQVLADPSEMKAGDMSMLVPVMLSAGQPCSSR